MISDRPFNDERPVYATGVVLAAGAGTRLGHGPKALLQHHGQPLVEIVAANLLSGGCHEVLIIVGAKAHLVEASANLAPYRTIVNNDWQTGMGSSFLAGAHAASVSDHIVVALVDQPGLTTEVVRRLLKFHKPGRITSAAYRDPREPDILRRGHPMVIDVSLREQVAATVTGDAGARDFLRNNPWLVDLIDCSDQSTGEDVDTPEQMYRLLSGTQNHADIDEQ